MKTQGGTVIKSVRCESERQTDRHPGALYPTEAPSPPKPSILRFHLPNLKVFPTQSWQRYVRIKDGGGEKNLKLVFHLNREKNMVKAVKSIRARLCGQHHFQILFCLTNSMKRLAGTLSRMMSILLKKTKQKSRIKHNGLCSTI